MADFNHDTVRELVLFAPNDARTYQQTEQYAKTLAKRRAKGTYDHAKALIGWGHVAASAARAYTREHCAADAYRSSYGPFSPADRRQAAVELQEYYEELIQDFMPR